MAENLIDPVILITLNIVTLTTDTVRQVNSPVKPMPISHGDYCITWKVPANQVPTAKHDSKVIPCHMQLLPQWPHSTPKQYSHSPTIYEVNTSCMVDLPFHPIV